MIDTSRERDRYKYQSVPHTHAQHLDKSETHEKTHEEISARYFISARRERKHCTHRWGLEWIIRNTSLICYSLKALICTGRDWLTLGFICSHRRGIGCGFRRCRCWCRWWGYWWGGWRIFTDVLVVQRSFFFFRHFSFSFFGSLVLEPDLRRQKRRFFLCPDLQVSLTWITRMFSPVSFASCSRWVLLGFEQDSNALHRIWIERSDAGEVKASTINLRLAEEVWWSFFHLSSPDRSMLIES